MTLSRKLIGCAAALLVCVLSISAFGQDAGGGGGAPPAGGGGPGGGRQRFDPTQIQQFMLQRLQDQLGASDDEFTAIKPKLQKVLSLQMDQMGFGMRAMFAMGGGRGGGPGGPGGGAGAPPPPDEPQTPLAKAAADLSTTLANKDAPAADIRTKLQAFIDAKTKAKADLAAAQKDLLDVLTQRQEATLALIGLVD